jgi:S-adenosylmethionine/arginine decarboxylase-like enzyme
MPMPNGDYGAEHILDIHNVEVERITEANISDYFDEACLAIAMEQVRKEWWIDFGPYPGSPHLEGVSGVQFIKTSSITVHATSGLGQVHINVFSCKPFSQLASTLAAQSFFGSDLRQNRLIPRR